MTYVANELNAKFCLTGTVSPAASATCTECANNKACLDMNEPTAPFTCDKGLRSRKWEYHCQITTIGGNDDPAELASDDFTAAPATMKFDYQVKALGKYSFKGIDTTASTKEWECPAGYMCPWPWRQIWLACPPGTYSAANQNQCTICPDNKVCDRKTATEIKTMIGFWSPLGTSLMFVAPAGYYQAQDGSQVSTGVLTMCGKGMYSEDKSNTCTECPIKKICPITSSNPLNCNIGTGTPDAVSKKHIIC